MTPEAQRIAIAGAKGWTDCHIQAEDASTLWEFDVTGTPPDWSGVRYQRVPNYPADLNAAITLCDAMNRGGYNCDIHREELDGKWRVTFSHLHHRNGYAEADTLAAAISEAYLKALNLWSEE